MKICYIISTCDKYLDNRVSYQMETMFKNINKNDIYYLTSKPNEERRQFGWYTMDDTQNITWKYIHFIYNMKDEFLNYDWYVLIDDDTFVFHERLQTYLSTFNSKENYYIGKELDHIKKDFCIYMSGGAGYVISKALYTLINEYIKKIGKNEAYYQLINLQEQFCDDLCIGLWIKEISKTNTVKQLNNNHFHLGIHENELQLLNAITFHKVIKKEQFDFYLAVSQNDNKIIKKGDTVFALITDEKYFNKAKITIRDLRLKGNWTGPIVVATIDFYLNKNFIDYYGITEVKFPSIDKSEMLEKIGPNGFTDGDKREINKINQWEKLHIFDEYFKRWERVVYLDSGLRIFEDVKYLLELDYKNKILGHIDGTLFKTQISYDNAQLVFELLNEYGHDILEKSHMLNCFWIYDTNILQTCNKSQLIQIMNKYPLCKCNEMTAMNLLLNFKYKLWQPFPEKATNGKTIFNWTELSGQQNKTWRDYCLIKYPVTIFENDI
jgi:hypothetical protein